MANTAARGVVPFVHSQVDAMLYIVEQESHPAGVLLRVSFGEPSSNDRIVTELLETLKGLELVGGRVCLISGPASLPVAVVIAHHVAHLFAVIGVFDPKLQKFVVSVSHDPEYRVGDTL